MEEYKLTPCKDSYICITNQLNSTVMPVRKVPGGYQWGKTGKVYPTQKQAEAQGKAIYASGYREKPSKKK